MNTVANTERPKLKLNFGAKPLTLNTNASPLVAGSALKKVVVFEKPKSDIKDVGRSPTTSDTKDASIGPTKAKSNDTKKSKKQEATAGNKQATNSNKTAANQKVVAVALTPAEILKEKIKRRKKEYFSILTKLKADFPEVFSEEPKPLAIGIDLELKKILNGQFPNNQLNRFFHRYCGSFKYKEKLVEGAQRFHLDGSPATFVTAKEVPVMVSKPRFNKKSRDSSETASTDSNEIKPTQ
ncbi:ProQ/FINO family protein [Rickettsia argasii]|uniref:ProQ/FINO family protein n=1 Tax=Rickettsia argasii T170-B TaxID=1268837 RepID=A0A0F3RF40_9RICK|nr:ProQ/FINO family protein [Rickettsia argasii]KJW03804.1 proQ/FINO family protein [Rickettsia argasii T170-B]